jgi:hypothetical protein
LQREHFKYPKETVVHGPKHTAKLAHRSDIPGDEL